MASAVSSRAKTRSMTGVTCPPAVHGVGDLGEVFDVLGADEGRQLLGAER
jgi:hypothetical protein